MIQFHYGSGSGPAWRVWLALEHKQLPYDLRVISFSAGDLKKPEFLALNPRGKVPTIVDGDFVLYESLAILDYLDAAYPERPIFPRDPKRGAVARRIVHETDQYLAAAVSRLTRQTIMLRGEPDPKEHAAARAAVESELALLEQYLQGDYLVGDLSAADFTAYPSLGLLDRIASRMPDQRVSLPPKLSAWAARMRALPIVEKTWPPHWKQQPTSA